jgi:protein O-GlcNAc transferase
MSDQISGYTTLNKIRYLVGQGRQFEALKTLEHLTSLLPQNPLILAQYARQVMSFGDTESAIRLLEQAATIDGSHTLIQETLACWRANIAEPLRAKSILEHYDKSMRNTFGIVPTSSNGMTDPRRRRINVGYISGDFNNHAAQFFIEPVLRNHDRSAFNIHCIMTGKSDVVTDRLKGLVENWHDVYNSGDADIASHIINLNLDVIVDLSGYTSGNRLNIFRHRVAPIQITWFGYMQTLGMRDMDFRITDKILAPTGTDHFYTERLIRLPSVYTFQSPTRKNYPPQMPWRKNGYPTVICLNDNRKISDTSLAIWSLLLKKNQKVRLIVISAERTQRYARISLESRLNQFEIPLNRVEVLPRQNLIQYMDLSSIADFALDTVPISGGTTTLLGLSMGLPTICIYHPSDGPLKSLSGSILKQVQLEQCTSNNEDDYLRLALDLCSNASAVEELRTRSIINLRNSPLARHKQVIFELEQEYKRITYGHFQAT